jgi:hypothetical protein
MTSSVGSLSVQVFHYHLVTSRLREVEARYIGKLGFDLVARYGRVGEDTTAFEPGTSWEDLARIGFKLRLSELQRGAVNVVLQPGQWDVPRVDHIGVLMDEDQFGDAIIRASRLDLRVQEHGGQRTFVSTGAGYRLELHPPREWLEELVTHEDELRISELHLLTDDPEVKALALARLLDLHDDDGAVRIGETVVRFLPGGPQGRPQLQAELLT